MTEELNLSWAQEAPDIQQSSPDVTEEQERVVVKTIPDQSWAMFQAMRFADLHAAGLRDPENLASALAESLSPALDLADGNADVLAAEQSASDLRRAALGLAVISPEIYQQQRDPRLVQQLIVAVLNGSGLESEFGADLEQVASDSRTAGITDYGVKKEAATGATSPQEARAREIAAKLGLTPPADEGWHELVPTVVAIDSTDPYIKKVVG
ncbi:MAG: hypothetical protein ABFE07_29490 [Armatimonadia bacterium]